MADQDTKSAVDILSEERAAWERRFRTTLAGLTWNFGRSQEVVKQAERDRDPALKRHLKPKGRILYDNAGMPVGWFQDPQPGGGTSSKGGPRVPTGTNRVPWETWRAYFDSPYRRLFEAAQDKARKKRAREREFFDEMGRKFREAKAKGSAESLEEFIIRTKPKPPSAAVRALGDVLGKLKPAAKLLGRVAGRLALDPIQLAQLELIGYQAADWAERAASSQRSSGPSARRHRQPAGTTGPTARPGRREVLKPAPLPEVKLQTFPVDDMLKLPTTGNESRWSSRASPSESKLPLLIHEGRKPSPSTFGWELPKPPVTSSVPKPVRISTPTFDQLLRRALTPSPMLRVAPSSDARLAPKPKPSAAPFSLVPPIGVSAPTDQKCECKKPKKKTGKKRCTNPLIRRRFDMKRGYVIETRKLQCPQSKPKSQSLRTARILPFSTGRLSSTRAAATLFRSVLPPPLLGR